MAAFLRHIESSLPSQIETNADLDREHPDWNVSRIAAKTGIAQRHRAAAHECASDLAFAAASLLLAQSGVEQAQVDFLLFCTQSPDYFLPTSACILQHRLGLKTECGALDFNLGCSGYVYGLGLARALINSGQASNVLLLTADTYSRYCRSDDRNVRVLFGDAGTASWISASQGERGTLEIGRPVLGTDGSGANHLLVSGGAARRPSEKADILMNGPEVFNFTLTTVPSAVNRLLQQENINLSDVGLFVFHQANAHMLQHLRDKLEIPPDRFLIDVTETGNTVSSSIPLALNRAQVLHGERNRPLLLCGFGVGSSWGSCLLR